MPKIHNLGTQTYYKVMYNPHIEDDDLAFSIRKVVYPNDPDERTRVGHDEERWRQAMIGQGILFVSWWSEDWHRQYHSPEVHRVYLKQEHERNVRNEALRSPERDPQRTCYQCGVDCEWLAPDSRCGDCTRFTPEEVAGELSGVPHEGC